MHLFGQVASFSSDTTKGCSPVTIQFENTSTGNQLSYRWSFGNGNISTLENPQAIYYAPGRYTVSLTVTDSSGQKSTATKTSYITVFKNPEAAFNGKPLTGCAPLTSNFKDKSTHGDAGIEKWTWDFGDGNTSTDSIGSHTYKAIGQFDVSLLVIDSNRCENKFIKSDYVRVLKTPEIAIAADKKYYCTPSLTVQFEDKSTNVSSSDTYLWEFGDGDSSNLKNPSHVYKTKGVFSVRLTITKVNGCKESKLFKDFIIIEALEVDFVADITFDCNPSKIRFTNLTKPTKDGIEFSWDFGDGGKAKGINTTHEYKTPGEYTVELTAKVDATCTFKAIKNAYIKIEASPEAAFDLSDTFSCKTPLLVYMDNKSKSSSIEWFVDSFSYGSQFNIGASLTDFGHHEIMLVASNIIGCKDTLIKEVIIEPIDLQLSSDVQEGCVPLIVEFESEAYSKDSIERFDWDFADGTSNQDTSNDIGHTFEQAGTYNVRLQVTSKSGCTTLKTIQIKVGQKTNPSFSLTVDSVCNNQLVDYLNTSNTNGINIDSVNWKVGKGNDFEEFSDGYNGAYNVDLDSGWYDIMLITYNQGCADSFVGGNQLFVYPPRAVIRSKDVLACSNEPFVLRDSSTYADSIVWHIYNGSNEFKEAKFSSVITLDTSYDGNQVILIAYNFSSGCIDSAIKNINFPKDITFARIIVEGNRCAPSQISFSAMAPNPAHNYYWIVGGDTIGGIDFEQYYPNADDYSMVLYVKNKSNPCVDFDTTLVTITGPDVDGELIASEGCSPLPIELKCNSDPAEYAELYWQIDDRRIDITSSGSLFDTLVKPGPSSKGIYVIQLIGIDSNGCQGIDEFPVEVKGVLNSRIEVRRFAKNCDGNNFIFQLDAPDYEIDSLDLLWDFGDSTSSTEAVVNKTFKHDGSYDVTLTIIESNGCVTKLVEPIDIKSEQLNVLFDADSLQTACPPLFVQFKNESFAKNRVITNYYWDFGDGSSSIEKNPSKLYLKAGHYTVKLKAVDEWGCVDSVIYKDFILVKGPIGSYSFDKKSGCVPLEVNYSSVTEGANFLEWDMGDGNVIKDKDSLTHTYYQAGRYIPLLILSDTFGCSYTLPPIDTIYVDPYPEAEIVLDNPCFGQEVKLSVVSDTSIAKIASYKWTFIQGLKTDSSSLDSPTFIFNKEFKPIVELEVATKRGCANKVITELPLHKIQASFLSNQAHHCVGQEIKVQNSSTSDTNIIAYEWTSPLGNSNSEELIISSLDTGAIPIKLKITDAIGCLDSIQLTSIIVGDTIPPLDLDVYRVSVNSDTEIVLDHQQSQNSDFESYLIYQHLNGSYKLIHEEFDKSKTTYLAQVKSTLDQSHCFKIEMKNACGLISDSFDYMPHCAIEVGAKPRINAIDLRWSSYKGWSSVKNYEVYRENVDIPQQFDLIGIVDGQTFNYTDSTVHCYISHSYKIKGIEENGNNQVSWSDSCAATPIWENTLGPNQLIRASVVDDSYTIMDWDSLSFHRMDIAKYVIEKSLDGIKYTYLAEYSPTTFTAKDLDVLVDDHSYFYRSYGIDVCGDTSPYSNFGKTIVVKASTDSTLDQKPMLDWSTYKGWTQGVDFYTIEIENEDGSFTEIGNTIFTDTSLTDEVTNLNQRANYCYRIIGHRNTLLGEPKVISISNVDCSPIRSLIWIPNVFSPNGDNLNDTYVTPGIYIKEYHIQIYNRWGELVFEGFDYYDNWDGVYLDKPAQQDAYMVIVETVGVDDVRRRHYGTVTLVR